jgi:hypothetical protein
MTTNTDKNRNAIRNVTASGYHAKWTTSRKYGEDRLWGGSRYWALDCDRQLREFDHERGHYKIANCVSAEDEAAILAEGARILCAAARA